MTRTPPTRVVLQNGDVIYAALPYREVRRLVEIARRRSEKEVRLNGRTHPLGRIAHVLAPQEPAQ